ncbi:uncharacterized protein LOC117179734 [Belonocnema kinseyi]|uniref:uncharacterized protein LOC117179734 n=1 Tax=Belonocnema kinseyi TaxID=2817044 RepID=UPI00143CC129|nr:uncharacterized protein LOC117179734 [Belonocnema kinseyi]
MIIVIFHVFYLLGQLIYKRYNLRKQRQTVDIANTECCGVMYLPSKDRNTAMEKLAQPPGDTSDDEVDMESKITFFPPAYIQRYIAVQAVLEEARHRGKLRKVVDFGCAELAFVKYLKNTPGVEEILCVDLDKELLEFAQNKAAPLHVDYLHTRDSPLIIRIIEGSVTHNDKLLEKTDAVICIELIEHLYPDTLTELPYNIFGYVKPQVAIMTTPNFEFNVLFKKPGFRHWDHKFEWTREQFHDWADNIVSRFPEYEVSFSGICKGPPGSEDLGCCSQMAIFHRHSDLNENLSTGAEGLFKVVATHEYPFHVDNRSDEQKVLDDTVYYIRSYSMHSLEFTDEVPLEKLLDPLKKYYVTIDSLKELLEQNGWTVVHREGGPVVLIPEPSESENSSDRENWNDFDSIWNDHEHIEDDWDADPGPPDHYSAEKLVDMVIQRENWDEEPSISADPLPEDLTAEEEASCLSTDVTRPVQSEENIERHQHANENRECISDISIEEAFQGPSTSSSYHILPVETEYTANIMKDPNPLTFSFKEILNHRTELSSQKLPEAGFEFHSTNDRSKNNSSSGNSPRHAHRKAPKKAMISRKGVFDELGSLCSMYLEPSRNENSNTCFEDLSNRSFESSISAMSSTDDSTVCAEGYEDLASSNGLSICTKKPRVDDSSTSFPGSVLNTSIKFASSPRTPVGLKRKNTRHEHLRRGKETLNEAEMREGMATSELVGMNSSLKSTSQTTLQKFSIVKTSSSSIERWYPEESNSVCKSSVVTLKGWSEGADNPRDDNEVAASDEHFEDKESPVDSAHVNSTTSLDNSRNSQGSFKIVERTLVHDGVHRESTYISNELRNIRKYRNVDPTETIEAIEAKEIAPKSEICTEALENLRGEAEFEKVIDKNRSSFVFLDLSQMIEGKAISSETLDTPPNSWSPEVMDSGYPNSASIHDMTPEYDLPSITHDRISDAESPSVAEAPRPGFLELVEVENGDLANNNRDYEGNNMIAVHDDEDDDLQPLIDVLEDDMENENDIYVLQNGFPAWLLRILQMQDIDVAGHMEPVYRLLDEAAGGDAANADFDEGFSSSSDEDLEDDDESSTSEGIGSLNIEDVSKDSRGDNP